MALLKQAKLKEIDAAYYVCITALAIFFISDACNKLLLYLQYDFYRVSIFVRSFYELLFLAIILLFINEVRLLFLKIFLGLFFLFVAGQILFAFQTYYKYNYLENILNFTKYFFVFMIYYAVYKLQEHPEKFKRNIKVLEYIFLFNSIAVIIGSFFQIGLLRTYLDQSYRYGYSGFIPFQNESTLFFFLALSYFYYKRFILNEKSNAYFIVLVSCILLGTKAIYIYLFILLIFHFSYHSKIKTKIIAGITIALVYLSINWFLNSEKSQVLLEYFSSRLEKYGWYEMLLSGRNNSIYLKGFEVVDKWNIINFFIGGQDQTRYLIEMDFIDLFLFLGAIGSISYMALYFTTLFKFNILKPFNFFFVSSFFFLAFFGGHFFVSAVNALYLCLVSLFLYQTQQPAAPIRP